MALLRKLCACDSARIQIAQAIFGLNSDDEFIVNATNDKEEIKKLLSVGFEYVCQKDDLLSSENENKTEHVKK